MDVFEDVDSRISCRWFLDRPVDPALVRNLIADAARAASGGNLQPWQVYALTGAALCELKRQVAVAIAGGDPRHLDAQYPIYPKTMWEPYRSRREHHGVQLYGALDIDRNDAVARLNQYKRNYEFFNAPVALFIAIDRRLGPGQWADLGGYIHALMYLARLSAFRLRIFSSVLFFVMPGHSRSWNGVVSLAYAGHPCRSFACTALPPALVGATVQHGPPA
jgi:nitroreductase